MRKAQAILNGTNAALLLKVNGEPETLQLRKVSDNADTILAAARRGYRLLDTIR